MPYYDVLTNVDKFLDTFQKELPENHRFQALDCALHTMPTRWWGTHKDNFDDWCMYRKMMRLRLVAQKFG